MMLTFTNIIDMIAENFFAGSTTLAGLAVMLAAWAICAVICINMKAPPTYSVVPMIPISIFFAAYGILNETITLLIVIVSAALVATEMRRTAD
jgi:hypothetical protein